jgi:prepilin-type N-terminal cleavage/methylation domain-containing protein
MFVFNPLADARVSIVMEATRCLLEIFHPNGVKRHPCTDGSGHPFPTYRNGFTLIEILSVILIMGVMVSVAAKKFDLLMDTAAVGALRIGTRELNTRETLEWTKMKLSDAGYTNDVDVYNAVDKNLGQPYSWNPGPTISNGTLHYGSESVDLDRAASTKISTSYWR